MDNLHFYIKNFIEGRQYILFDVLPLEVGKILLYYQDVCRNIDEFDEILLNLQEQRKLPSPTKNLGRNDSSLIVYGDNCILDCEFISGLQPIEIPTDDIIYFFTEFRKVYIKYQNVEIPGIIPESKLDTWSCVPNEYIKDEWWDKQKQQEGGA